jgi:hypothetical protein
MLSFIVASSVAALLILATTVLMRTRLHRRAPAVDGTWGRGGRALSPSTDLPAGSAPWADVRKELQRCRRYERPLALIRMSWPSRTSLGGRLFGKRAAREHLRRAIAGAMRDCDLYLEESRHLYLVLPECDRDAAQHLLGRLVQAAPDTAFLDVAVAEFPRDGLTIGGLLRAVELEVHPVAATADEEVDA